MRTIIFRIVVREGVGMGPGKDLQRAEAISVT